MNKTMVNMVYVKNTKGVWQVKAVYAKNHTARARASEIRATGKESFVLRRTLRGA